MTTTATATTTEATKQTAAVARLARVRDRIRGLARLPASRLRPAGRNFRTHDDRQRRVLRGLLTELGVVGAVLVWVPDEAARKRLRATPEDKFDKWLANYDGVLELIDGHMRADELKAVSIPVLVTDLDEAEAAKALATFDAVSDFAGTDSALLAELLSSIGKAADDGTEELLATLRKAEPKPPADFPVFDASIPVDHTCPKCAYSWSGTAGESK